MPVVMGLRGDRVMDLGLLSFTPWIPAAVGAGMVQTRGESVVHSLFPWLRFR